MSPPSSGPRRVSASTHLGTTTQAEFLVGLGTEDLLRAIQADPATAMEDYLAVRSALVRLLDPAAMGRFRVIGFGREWPDGPPLAGIGYRLAPIASRLDQGSIWIESTICRSSVLTVPEAPGDEKASITRGAPSTSRIHTPIHLGASAWRARRPSVPTPPSHSRSQRPSW